MVIYCTSPQANQYDIYIHVVSRGRLEYGKAYEVPDDDGEHLLASGLFGTVAPGGTGKGGTGKGEHEPVASTATARPQNLQRVQGIGPMIALALGELGIFTLDELAAADAVELDRTLDGSSLDQIQDWQAQAKNLKSEEQT